MATRGRPPTGETKVMGFRPPAALRAEFEQLAAAEGRKPSDALVEAMHLWIEKHGGRTPAPPGAA